MTSDFPVDILVVEDNDKQRESIVACIEDALENVCVAAAAGSDEALAILFSEDDREPPKLVLLDLSLSPGSGLDILERIRACGAYTEMARTPVVIFTDSHSGSDMREGYRLGANSYVYKPIGYNEFRKTVASIAAYWMSCNQTNS